MVKTIQQMKRVNLGYPERPKKTDTECCNSSRDPDADAFDMVGCLCMERRLQVDEIKDGQIQD